MTAKWPDVPMITTDTIISKSPVLLSVPNPQLDDLAVIQFTSGSTSFPKGVMITHRCMLGHSQLSRDQLKMGKPESFAVSWVPHWHDYGLFGGIANVLYLEKSTIF